MNELNQLHVGRSTTRGAMTVFPLWGPTGRYRRYAMDGRNLDVTEVESGPDMGTLMVGNVGDQPALVLDGQLFEGGWQHRMARHSVMIGVHQRIPVEVACVEHGRWGGTARQHSRGRRATPYVRDAVRGDDVQTDVWSRVAEHTRNQAGGANPTGSFVHRLDRADDERRAWADVRPLAGQIGVLIGIGGQPYVVELFDSPIRLRGQLPGLLESAAVDARLASVVETPGRRARRFVERLEHLRLDRAEKAGIGERRHGASEYADLSVLTWRGRPVHRFLTNVRHPLLAA
ncbi:ARPP-1 family domain-containing protein [Nocardioides ochotonae]|uniref:ARPP-1 family domain-containing protein n=1 Tax=Nocardioides ochotonae TaxID=2685869 RepID=UPI001409D0A0|nr:DUF6569 family protein [Nocardioides ochotonae]